MFWKYLSWSMKDCKVHTFPVEVQLWITEVLDTQVSECLCFVCGWQTYSWNSWPLATAILQIVSSHWSVTLRFEALAGGSGDLNPAHETVTKWSYTMPMSLSTSSTRRIGEAAEMQCEDIVGQRRGLVHRASPSFQVASVGFFILMC